MMYQELEDGSSGEIGDGGGMHLQDPRLVGEGLAEHAEQRFPLVAVEGVADEGEALAAQEAKKAKAMEAVQEAAAMAAAFRKPSPAQVAPVGAPVVHASEALLHEGARIRPVILVVGGEGGGASIAMEAPGAAPAAASSIAAMEAPGAAASIAVQARRTAASIAIQAPGTAASIAVQARLRLLAFAAAAAALAIASTIASIAIAIAIIVFFFFFSPRPPPP
jgi:hypothetical protein